MRHFSLLAMFWLLMLLSACAKQPPASVDTEEEWFLGRSTVHGKPVLTKSRTKMPPVEVRKQYPVPMIVSWRVGSANGDGIPTGDSIASMSTFEEFFRNEFESKGMCKLAYSQIGNSMIIYVYYVRDSSEMLPALNSANQAELGLPLSTDFYSGDDWNALQKIFDRYYD